MFCFKPRIGLILLSLVLFAALPAGGHAAASSPRLQEVTPPNLSLQQLAGQSPELQIVLRDFKAEAVAKGSIHVAVKLPVAFAPEKILREGEKLQQRADIEAAVLALRANLPQVRTFEAVPGLPYVRLILDGAGLARLETIPGLTRITRAEEMNWPRDFVALKQAEMRAALGLPDAPRAGSGQLEVVSPTVVGGRTADPGTHPFQVAVVVKGIQDDRSAHYCGGVLVAERFVLTNWHCSPVDPQEIQVLVGTQRLDGSGRRIDVSRIYEHPDWFAYDIAVLELATPVTDIPFAKLATTPPTILGTPLRATGWGLSGRRVFPIDLQQIDVPMVQCPYWGSEMICAGARDRDSCSGDSGGPLTINRGRGYDELVGITKGGMGYEGSPVDGCGEVGFYLNISHPPISSFINSIVTYWVGFPTSVVSMGEGESIEVTVERRKVDQRVTLDYRIVPIGADTAGGFNLSSFATPVSGRLTLEPGSSTAAIPLKVRTEARQQGSRLFRIELSGGTPGWTIAPNNTLDLWVEDRIREVGFRDSAITIKEDDQIPVPVSRVHVNQAVTLDYRIEYDGIPTRGGFSLSSFVTPRSGRLTIAPGSATASIPVKVRKDGEEQRGQSFRIILSNPSPGWTLGRNQVMKLRVEDNNPRVGFREGNIVVKEGERRQVLVERLNVNQRVTLNYRIEMFGAPPGSRFNLLSFATPVSGRLTLEPGASTVAIPLQVREHSLRQGLQGFRIILSNPTTGWSIGPMQTLEFWVVDKIPENFQVGFVFDQPLYAMEGERVRIPVDRRIAHQSVTLNYRIEYGWKLLEGDRLLSSFETPISGTVTLKPGAYSAEIPLLVPEDAKRQEEMLYRITLSNPPEGWTIGPNQTVEFTIGDND